jgi:uncharacterized protein
VWTDASESDRNTREARAIHTPPDPQSRREFLRAGLTVPAAFVGALVACDVREFAHRHGAKRRLSIATGGSGAVIYIYGGAIAKVISTRIPNVEATAELTAGSVANLELLARGAVDLALVSSDVLDDGLRRRGAFAAGPVPTARTLVNLYGAAVHVATFADRHVGRLADLRGRRVSTGAPGAGTETMALRILAAVGIDPDRDLRRDRLSFSASADALKDGKLDACFIGGGVPHPAVMDLARTHGRRLRLLELGEVQPALQRTYGANVYQRFDIPRGTYPGVDATVRTLGFKNVLVADERLDETLVHDITRALFDHRTELIAVHPVARELTLASASQGSPVPFHAGAIRYFREVGAWRG